MGIYERAKAHEDLRHLEPHELKMAACRIAAHQYVDKMFDSEDEADQDANHLMIAKEHEDFLDAKEAGEVMSGEGDVQGDEDDEE